MKVLAIYNPSDGEITAFQSDPTLAGEDPPTTTLQEQLQTAGIAYLELEDWPNPPGSDAWRVNTDGPSPVLEAKPAP